MAHSQLLTRCPGVSGSGVFALRRIAAGKRLLQFTGPLLETQAQRFALAHSDVDEYLQVSATHYMGPSGELDDFVNHSCEPNCGLVFGDSEIWLVSLTKIATGQEVSFDYATTQNEYPHRFRCLCGSRSCRGMIGDFDELPAALKRRYHELGILSPWLSERYLAGARRRRVRRQATSSRSVFSSPE